MVERRPGGREGERTYFLAVLIDSDVGMGVVRWSGGNEVAEGEGSIYLLLGTQGLHRCCAGNDIVVANSWNVLFDEISTLTLLSWAPKRRVERASLAERRDDSRGFRLCIFSFSPHVENAGTEVQCARNRPGDPT